MNAKVTVPGPSAKGIWAVFWRAVLLTPLAVVFGVFLLSVWCGLFVVPVLVILSIWLQDWLQMAVYLAVWPVLYGLIRSKWFRVDRHDIVNDRENI
jgi:hypothetical protein